MVWGACRWVECGEVRRVGGCRGGMGGKGAGYYCVVVFCRKVRWVK